MVTVQSTDIIFLFLIALAIVFVSGTEKLDKVLAFIFRFYIAAIVLLLYGGIFIW